MDRDQWDERYGSMELVWTAEANRFVVEELAGLPPGRALDLGAGEGRNAIWLAEQGWQVTAVDFSPVALAKAAKLAEARGVTGVDWVEADLRTYQPGEDAYDLVLLAYIHLPPDEFRPLLAAAAAALAPGGTLLVVGHDVDNIAHGHGGPQDPQILHRADEVVHALPGLTIRRAAQARRPVTTDEGERVAIDTVVRAQRP
ncbi:MAG TPA: methyltransferase domain-containing protein [Streptosporangiaceae bacterium]|nr:methyltransferase domain-containing protein [Streptosporangiaceae bacterium]